MVELNFKNLSETLLTLNKVFEESTAKAINRNITARNWLTGFYIVNYEQNGKDRAEYGEKIIRKLADRLNKKSLSYRNLQLYKQFYLEFKVLEKPIKDFVLNEFRAEENLIPNSNFQLLEEKTEITKDCATTGCTIQKTDEIAIPADILFKNLSFTHFTLIMGVENPLARTFYELETIKGIWTKRELKRQIDTNYFERSAISTNPEKMSLLVQSKSEKLDLQDVIKSPFVYEFLGLKDREVVDETDLEIALMNHLEEFLLELGTGFCFEARQKRIVVDDDYFFCDLVFYHRILKCHVLIDLKSSKIKYDDIAQMNLYLSYYKKNVMQEDDNPPVGILMCTQAGKEFVEYASNGIDENLFVQKYKLNLPEPEKLTEWLKNEVGKFGN
ncbi:MAG: PDDEXK nuclease domain-containing protein [Treponema sp.]|nr:PDDEXK nuclease domain-containing protein [Treponema sp.]